MAATNETTNYGLPQWESTDKPEMVDFNQAMSDIDSNLNLVQSDVADVVARLGGVKIVTGKRTITSDVAGSFSLVHNGGFTDRYTFLANISINTAEYITADAYNFNESYCILHSASGSPVPSVTRSIYFTAIGV